MDLNKAILYGQLVKAAYDIPTNDLTNKAGQITRWKRVTTISGTDTKFDFRTFRGRYFPGSHASADGFLSALS